MGFKKLVYNLIVIPSIFLSLFYSLDNLFNIKYDSITWNEYHSLYNKHLVDNKIIIYNNDYASVSSYNKTLEYRINIPNEDYIEKQISTNNVKYMNLFNRKLSDINIEYYKPSLLLNIFSNIPYTLIILIISMVVSNRGLGISSQLMDINVLSTKSKITLDDIGGAFNSKKELLDLVNVFKDSNKFEKIGGRAPKGVLLEGPPGTGKTMISRAIANELNMTFIILSGSDLIKPIVGIGSMYVKEIFKKAKLNKPTIIFIDEIDAIGKSRDNMGGSGINERDNILNTLLVEMDGFVQHNGVLVIGATNRADILDKALLRPGRFDRIVKFNLPTRLERVDIIKKYMDKYTIQKEEFSSDIINSISHQAHSFSGADIENIFAQAAIETFNNQEEIISVKNILESLDFVQLGSIVEKNLSSDEEETIAVHESGHALVAFELDCNPEYVTIVPRSKGTLGFTKIIPKNEQNLHTYNDFFNQICILLGGRYAELFIMDKMTEGASNDLYRATKLANEMIKNFGMKNPEKHLNTNNLLLNDNRFYSENSQFLIEKFDKEVIELMTKAEKYTSELIEKNIPKIKQMAEVLKEKKNIDKKSIHDIFKPKNN